MTWKADELIWTSLLQYLYAHIIIVVVKTYYGARQPVFMSASQHKLKIKKP